MLKKIRGQSVLEYVIVLTAIIAAVIAGALTLGSKSDTGGLGKLLKKSADKIKTESNKVATMVPATIVP